MNENEQRVAENMSANGTVPVPAYVGKKYKLVSVRGTFFTMAGSGMIRNTVTFDQEKMNIETQPAKKSTIPVLWGHYFCNSKQTNDMVYDFLDSDIYCLLLRISTCCVTCCFLDVEGSKQKNNHYPALWQPGCTVW